MENNSYNRIFKSTFLFGSVQVFNIMAKVGINKAVAIFLGTEGMGIIGLLQSTINVLSTACGLGISQSAVKDISQGFSTSKEDFDKSISLTKKLTLLAATIGLVTTIILSPLLSRWTFDSDKYTYVFVCLSVVVFLQIITEGQLAILKGARMLRLLAKASLFGATVGLFTSVPLYFLFGENGVVPSLIVSAVVATGFSLFFVRKLDFTQQVYTFKKAIIDGKVMIKMGIALMYVNFLMVFADYIIRTFIGNFSTIETVGLFQAGIMIISSYFGIIITALTTDYYPRLAAINKDNKAINKEFNKQSEVGLLLAGPLIVIFLFAMPLFIKLLYTDAFLPTLSFLEYAIFGVLFTVSSNALGIILLAKQATKKFFFTATVGRIVIVPINIIFFYIWGLEGLGISYIIAGLFHISLMSMILWKAYRIKMSMNLIYLTLTMLGFAVCAFFAKDIDSIWQKSLVGFLIIGSTMYYSIYKTKTTIGIDVIQILKNKLKR